MEKMNAPTIYNGSVPDQMNESLPLVEVVFLLQAETKAKLRASNQY